MIRLSPFISLPFALANEKQRRRCRTRGPHTGGAHAVDSFAPSPRPPRLRPRDHISVPLARYRHTASLLVVLSELGLSVRLSLATSALRAREMEMRRWKSTITDATATTSARRPRAVVRHMHARVHTCTRTHSAAMRFKYRRRRCRRHTRVVAACATARDDRVHTNCAAYPAELHCLVLCIRNIAGIRTRAAAGGAHDEPCARPISRDSISRAPVWSPYRLPRLCREKHSRRALDD